MIFTNCPWCYWLLRSVLFFAVEVQFLFIFQTKPLTFEYFSFYLRMCWVAFHRWRHSDKSKERIPHMIIENFSFCLTVMCWATFPRWRYSEVGRQNHDSRFRQMNWLRSGSNTWRKSLRKWRNTLKMAVLTKESKFFIKAKLILSKSCLLGLLCLIIWRILGGALF